ncbi:MAG: cupredoxin domain-containing protein [Alphaproteobacteria bacterium]
MPLRLPLAVRIALLTAIPAFPASAAAEPANIVQREERFRPATIVLKRGQTLVVTNEDPFVHHVFIENPNMKYDSGEQRTGRVLSITFDKAGEYVLECAIHLKMKLKVVVKE